MKVSSVIVNPMNKLSGKKKKKDSLLSFCIAHTCWDVPSPVRLKKNTSALYLLVRGQCPIANSRHTLGPRDLGQPLFDAHWSNISVA